MAKKKEKDVEEVVEREIDDGSEEVTVDKKQTFGVRWFQTNVVEDSDTIRMICDLTAKSAARQFSIYTSNKGNSEIYALVFFTTMIEILNFVATKRKTYNEFTIAIANSINVGFTNNLDENNENVGHFTPILEYIGTNMEYIDPLPSTEVDHNRMEHNAIAWKTQNLKKNAEFIKEIQNNAYRSLFSDYKIDIRNAEVVIPLFCIFMDYINAVLKLKFQEAIGTGVSEVQINVMGLFKAYYSYDQESDKEVYEYTPSPRVKLALKSDNIAGRN